MRLAIMLVILIGIIYATFTSVSAASVHTDGACPVQVWDQKTGSTSFWWKAVTACNDFAAEELNHTIRLQYFDWSDNTWRDSFQMLAGNALNSAWLADNRTWEVEAWQELFCYRVRGRHRVFEWSKNAYAEGETYSWGQCY